MIERKNFCIAKDDCPSQLPKPVFRDNRFSFFFPFAATVLSPTQEALGSLANTEFLAKMKSLEENITYLHQTLVRDLVVRYKGKFGLKKMHNFRQE